MRSFYPVQHDDVGDEDNADDATDPIHIASYAPYTQHRNSLTCAWHSTYYQTSTLHTYGSVIYVLRGSVEQPTVHPIREHVVASTNIDVSDLVCAFACANENILHVSVNSEWMEGGKYALLLLLIVGICVCVQSC